MKKFGDLTNITSEKFLGMDLDCSFYYEVLNRLDLYSWFHFNIFFKMVVHIKKKKQFLRENIQDFLLFYRKRKRDRGNFLVKRGEYSLALNSYSK